MRFQLNPYLYNQSETKHEVLRGVTAEIVVVSFLLPSPHVHERLPRSTRPPNFDIIIVNILTLLITMIFLIIIIVVVMCITPFSCP